MLQNGGECFEKTAGSVMNLKILHMVANRQALFLNDIRLLRRVEGFFSIFWTDKLHEPLYPEELRTSRCVLHVASYHSYVLAQG
jgi:hypothetical protein